MVLHFEIYISLIFMYTDIDEIGEWREGASPSRSRRTGREPLDSSGSHHPAVAFRFCQWANSQGWRRAMRANHWAARRLRPFRPLYFRIAHLVR